MAIPTGYFYRQGFYWKVDGTGPYTWNGTSMVKLDRGVVATATAVPVGRSLFNRDESGPATA